MKKFFDNIWTKRVASFFGTFYFLIIAVMAYCSIFYNIHITDKTMYLGFIITVSLLFGTLMIYSKNQIYTRVLSIVMIPLLLPTILINFGNWLLIIPIAIFVIAMFFICGTSEGTKTILGTVFLLLYILGALAYFLLTTLFTSGSQENIVQTAVSSTQTYRCYVVNTVDSSTGSTQIYVEPNYYDIDSMFIMMEAKGYRRICYNIREKREVTLEWRNDDLYVDGEIRFKQTEAVEKKWFDKGNRKIQIN